MKSTTAFFNLILILLLSPILAVHGQDLFLSIAGENSTFRSGDNHHQYDIWIKPDTDAKKANIQVYDAGINGDIDQITTTTANTTTTFRLYEFDELYILSGNQLVQKDNAGPAIETLTARDEDLFKKRWEQLSQIRNESENGYIVRITTDKGSDVNNFSLRVVNDTGIQLNNNSWKIITIDLSIGIFNMAPKQALQIKPYNPTSELPELLIAGEEDSKLKIIDALGNTFLAASGAGISLDNRFGIENTWALNISGSKEILNNLTVYGRNRPQLWLFESAGTTAQEPNINITTTTASNCTDKSFRLQSDRFQQREMQNAEWKLNEETLATGFSPSISFSARGNQTINAFIPDPNTSALPQYWTASADINITTPPIARLEVPKEIVAPNEIITLSAENSYDLSGQELTYTWFVNGRPNSKGPTFDFSSEKPGTFIISVRVSNAGEIPGCNNRQRQVRIRVNSKPYAEIDYDSTFQTGEYLTFSVMNENDDDNDSLSYKWDGLGVVSDDNNSREVNISHMATGIFDITLTVDDNTNTANSRYSVTQNYTVTPPTKTTAKPTVVDSVSTDSTMNKAVQDNQEINVDADITPALAVAAPLPVVAPRRPESSIKAPQLTSDSKVNFALADSLLTSTNTDTATYTWDFGDGTVTKGIDPKHTYTKPGTYAVNVTIDQGSDIVQKRHVIVINEYPVADFDIPDTLAAKHNFVGDGSKSRDNDGYITSYQWFINGVPVSNEPVATLNIKDPGEHTISLRVVDNSSHEKAQDLISKNVWVNHSPVPKWEFSPDKIAPGTEVNFDASRSYDPDGTITEIFWKFADGTVMKGAKVTKRFEESGPQYFTLTLVDDNGVENSTIEQEGSVNVNHPPYIITEKVVNSNSINVELDASETYDVDNDQVFFEWILPDGSARNEASFNWRAPDFGVHIVSLTVHDGLGLSNSSNQETIRVLINRPVEAVVDSLIETCSGQTVLFNSSRSYDPDGDNFNVKWYFGNGDTSDAANPSYIYDAPGIYEAQVELTDGISKEKTVARIPVVVGGSPVAKMNVRETTVCVNRPIKFDGSESRDPSGALPSLVWELGDGTTESGPNVEHIYTEPGMYPVSLTVIGSGSAQCGNTNQVRTNIRVIEGPNAIFNLQEWATPGEIILLDGSESISDDEITNASWNVEFVPDGSVDSLSGMQAEYQFNKPGEYLVTLFLNTSSSTSCNTVSLTKSVKVNATPIINWTLPEAVPAGTDLNLNAMSSEDPDGFIKEFRWYLNGKLIGNNASKIIKTIEPGNHTVVLEVTDNSPSENNQTRMQKTFFANSSPQPTIKAPGKVYINREVNLTGGPEFDDDGDRLSSQWKVNGQLIQNSTFTPTEVKNYRITLIQDDGRGVSNSVDSAVVEIIPIGHPEIDPEFPSKISLGGIISIENLQISDSDDWKFFVDGSYQGTWTAESTGNDSLQLTWFFENRPTSTISYPITVYEPLQFISEADTVRTAEWNPANPHTVITAPEVNREIPEVNYTWFKDGEEIGSGVRINLSIQEGENRFKVRVKDLFVKQTKPIETELKVIAEN
ncbi:MAG: PKD domain-containing protein [Balneolaceae bacterium]